MYATTLMLFHGRDAENAETRKEERSMGRPRFHSVATLRSLERLTYVSPEFPRARCGEDVLVRIT